MTNYWFSLPELVSPVGDGYMNLCQAAQWIATIGGSFDFSADDSAIWRPAFAELLLAISSERIALTGERSGETEIVPAFKLHRCPIVCPYEVPGDDLLDKDMLYLQAHTLDSEEEWEDGFNDKLTKLSGDQWTKLAVLKRDVLQNWPFREIVKKRGKPGRPSTVMPLIVTKLRTLDETTLTGTPQRKLARDMIDWLALEHRGRKLPAVSTVEKAIREERNARARKL